LRFSEYTQLREKRRGIYFYGLYRRLEQIKKLIDQLLHQGENEFLNIVDFGCADNLTLDYLLSIFGDKIQNGIGLDIFPNGKPPQTEQEKISFIKIDLFKDFPYPLEDCSFNVAICSAFFKHHPFPERFMSEVWRILQGGGYVIILDPSPWVMAIGMKLKYFEGRYSPNVWNRNLVSLSGSKKGMEYKFEEILYERYWIAPNRFLYNCGMEKLFSRRLVQYFGLHQSLLLKKVGLE